MSNPLPKSELLGRLLSAATSAGATAGTPDDGTVAGEQEAIQAKWFLGGRKVTYKFRCQLDDASGAVRFREAAIERSWGIPPPTMTVEKTSQLGTRVSENRTDKSVGGGGTLEFGHIREAIERAAGDAGWTFALEPGRMP